MPDSEAPDADAAEQLQPVVEHERELDTAATSAEVDEGDLAESLREVPVDDDEYR